MKTETVSPDKLNARIDQLLRSGYTIVSQGDAGVVFQKKKNSLSNVIVLLGIVATITIVGAPIGIPLIILGVIAKICSGTNYNQILLKTT